MPVPIPDKWGGLRQEGHLAQKCFAKTFKCVIIIKPYRINRGPGYQQPPQVTHSRASVEIMLLLNIVKIEEKERRKTSEEAAGSVERKTITRKVGILNIGTMTGRGRELVDLMERWNVDIETK